MYISRLAKPWLELLNGEGPVSSRQRRADNRNDVTPRNGRFRQNSREARANARRLTNRRSRNRNRGEAGNLGAVLGDRPRGGGGGLVDLHCAKNLFDDGTIADNKNGSSGRAVIGHSDFVLLDSAYCM